MRKGRNKRPTLGAARADHLRETASRWRLIHTQQRTAVRRCRTLPSKRWAAAPSATIATAIEQARAVRSAYARAGWHAVVRELHPAWTGGGGTDNVANGRRHCGGVAAEDSETTQGRVPNGGDRRAARRRGLVGTLSADIPQIAAKAGPTNSPRPVSARRRLYHRLAIPFRLVT